MRPRFHKAGHAALLPRYSAQNIVTSSRFKEEPLEEEEEELELLRHRHKTKGPRRAAPNHIQFIAPRDMTPLLLFLLLRL